MIQKVAPDRDDLRVRKHLNDFLFSTQKEVHNYVRTLSGGEKARLSLAVIAAQQAYLLLLDEITNNIDRVTREYIIDVLKVYPGAMIVVTHDPMLLQELAINNVFVVENGKLHETSNV